MMKYLEYSWPISNPVQEKPRKTPRKHWKNLREFPGKSQ
jgi:hypothetical protein